MLDGDPCNILARKITQSQINDSIFILLILLRIELFQKLYWTKSGSGSDGMGRNSAKKLPGGRKGGWGWVMLGRPDGCDTVGRMKVLKNNPITSHHIE